jgi:cytochrome P450
VNSSDAELGGYKIPKNTRIIFNLYAQNNDPKYWKNPEKFDPNRFLDENGVLKKGKIASFVTFGLGRRGCPGEKIALENAFLMITRLMQNIRIELETGDYSADLIPINILLGFFPKNYKIRCFSRK